MPKDWGDIRNDYRRGVDRGVEETRWTFGKVIGTIVLIFVIVGGISWGLGLFGEAASVAREEFGPRAALTKYEWFVEQSNAIEKMDQDIAMFEQRVSAVDEQYAAYGEDKSKWAPDVRMQYNRDRSHARDDLVAVASQRNNLAKEYNAASRKFNWSPFQTNPDKPAEYLEEYAIK